MTRALTFFAVALTTSVVSGQEPQQSFERRAVVGTMAQGTPGARVALETRITRDKPYSAEATTEFVQVLGDGNRIVRRNTARLYRDGDGRTRREELNEGQPDRNSVVITDPVAGTSLILHASTKTAIKAPALFARMQGPGAVDVAVDRRAMLPKVEGPAAGDVKRPADGAAQVTVRERGGEVSTFTLADGGLLTSSAARGETSKEDLGEQTIEGVSAKGTRVTTVIPAGAIGNEQPITIVSEEWYSSDLGMLVLTRHSDPRVGETSYRITNIVRNEPDRALFQVPADYTVQDGASIRMLRKDQ